MNRKPGCAPVHNPKVAIIIVNWNGWRDTKECLESLQSVAYPNFSVYVVDNGSTDESYERLIDCQPPTTNHQLIRSETNRGFAGGNNIGIKKALADGAEYILLLNNDTLTQQPTTTDFLTELVKAAGSDSRIGIIGPKIYFAQETRGENFESRISNLDSERKIWFGAGKLNWLRTRGYHLNYEVIDENTSPDSKFQILNSDYITGCCLLIKKSVIECIGLLSEDYFLYYEDVDWCLRAKKARYRIAYLPSAHIWHKVSRSAKAGSASYVYYHVRNGLMLAWRHGDTLRRAVLTLFTLWTIAKQCIKLLIPAKRMWAIAALKGVRDFIFGVTGKKSSHA